MRELVRELVLALREQALPMLGSGAEFQMSVVASANEALHGRIVEQLGDALSRVNG
jgi:hypothetical protein